jgi:hypothetical protein
MSDRCALAALRKHLLSPAVQQSLAFVFEQQQAVAPHDAVQQKSAAALSGANTQAHYPLRAAATCIWSAMLVCCSMSVSPWSLA